MAASSSLTALTKALTSGALHARNLSTVAQAAAAIKLPDLQYDYGALEPFISAQIMEIHHKKHHQTYINNLIQALDKLETATKKGDIAQMIALQSAINFNGGGHINHSIFWQNLAPNGKGGGGAPTGELGAAINKQWGSFEAFKTKFQTASVAVQGSGWGWLGYNADKDCLEIATCANQDPLAAKGLVPLLGIDVWEHAYYLQYKNVRPDYVTAIWNVVNFGDVSQRFAAARAARPAPAK